MSTFKAIVIEKAEEGAKPATRATLTPFDDANLMDGDVTVRVGYSTINYKDGLAITGSSPVVRKFPMVPGIDLVGTVSESSHADWKAGDTVVAGQRVGLIRFGSRVDVYLPSGTSSQVLLGQRTIAGETIIAKIGTSELIEGVAQ